MRWIALELPLPWPRGFRTLPEVDQERGGTRPAEFAADVEELRRLVERFAAPTPDFAWREHPYFGRLTPAQWYRWGYLHLDHHLRQFGA